MSKPTIRYPCPNCGRDRSSDRNGCDACGWPKRRSVQPVAPQKSRPFQFHLRSLFLCLSIACVVFALVGRFGVDGFVERLEAAFCVSMVFFPLFEFYDWWRKHDLDNI
jgi:hypothetical protein